MDAIDLGLLVDELRQALLDVEPDDVDGDEAVELLVQLAELERWIDELEHDLRARV